MFNLLIMAYVRSLNLLHVRADRKRLHVEIDFLFSLNYLKSYCFYHFPIDFESKVILCCSK